MGENKIVLIKVKAATREALKKRGIKGDTYDDIINQLLRLGSEWNDKNKSRNRHGHWRIQAP